MSDLAVIAEPGALDQYADPGEFVVLACERAREWLRQAIEHGDIGGIRELKSQAEAVRVYTAQKQIGHDAELAAAEIVRRAERGIGLAIRMGQANGTIAKRGDQDLQDRETLAVIEVSGAKHPSELTRIYQLTDGVSDEQFDAALDAAKADGDLRRTNVVREVARQKIVNGHKPVRSQYGTRHEALRGTRHLNSRRIVTGAISSIDGIGVMFKHINYTELDVADVDGWITVLNESIRSLTTLRTRLKEIIQP